jgi:Flp pilus assembly protein TadG
VREKCGHPAYPLRVGTGRGKRSSRRYADERGAMVVLFALLLPLFLALGSIVFAVGNWWVHDRHLQMQVDSAAFAAGTQFTGCFTGMPEANTAIRTQALAYAGDSNRDPATTNLQVQEPADAHVVFNSSRYWQDGDAIDDSGLSATLDNTITYPGDTSPPPADPSDPCETKFLDVKSTDDDVPSLLPWLSFTPDAKAHARVEIRKVKALSGMLPFAVPEVDPGAVAVILTDEDAADGNEVLATTEISRNTAPPPAIAKYNVYDGLVGGIELSSRDNVSVIVLVSAVSNPDPDLSGPSVAVICGRPGVRCYSAGGKQAGLALIHGYSTGSSLPALHRVDLTGCNDTANPSGPYFSRTGDCFVAVSADIDFGGASNPQARLHGTPGCNGSGTSMSQSGSVWTAVTTLPEPTKFTGQVSFSISWKAGSGGFTCFEGGTVARPYVANGSSGPVEYLSLQAYDKDGTLMPSSYSLPKEPTMQPYTFMVTVGLRPPLRQSTLNDEALLIRFATEDDPSLTQSIDCDVDSYDYPDPFGSMPKDAAEIAHGCVTPYAVNPTLDCSDYGLGDLPPDPAPALNDATDCAQSKNGQVSSLRQGLSARFENPCTPNYWPDAPITPQKVQTLVDSFGTDPRMVTLVVTDFGAFASTGSTIIPIKYFAGFYVTGWDYSHQSPGCPDPDGFGPLQGNDPHPIYGTAYQQNKPHLDDGDVWGYFITPVIPAPAGSASDELCAFDELGTCIAVLVE